MMQRRHFERAAGMVRAIAAGDWSDRLPEWATFADGRPGYSPDVETSTEQDGNIAPAFVRAVWTCEAFARLFAEDNPQFDIVRFRVACGLQVPPAGRTSTGRVSKRRTS